MSEPSEHEPQWVDTAISNLLRIGVLASVTVIVIGLVISFMHHPQYAYSTNDLGRLTSPAAAYPHDVRGVVEQILARRGQAVVMLGLLLLIATPVLRVAFSIVAFALQRDRLYVAITIFVLALLMVSFAIGTAG